MFKVKNNLAKRSKLLLFVLIALLCSMSLTGCEEKQLETNANITVNKTVSLDSLWIDSGIYGAIDETLETNKKDDFFTAVNKEWILKQNSEGCEAADFMTGAQNIVDERMQCILRGEGESEDGKNDVGIPQNWLIHDRELLTEFFALASDWEKRNQEKSLPLAPYIEAIEQIKNMDEMTDYLTNRDKTNLAFVFPVKMTVGTPVASHDKNTVFFDCMSEYSLSGSGDYTELTDQGLLYRKRNELLADHILGELGYTEREKKQALEGCYRFEMRLAQIEETFSGSSYFDLEKVINETDNWHTLGELTQLAGNYPIAEILSAYGYDHADSYNVYYPKYISAVGALYKEKYLEEMKDYFLVHTMIAAADYLDRETFDAVHEIMDNGSGTEEEENGEKKTEEEELFTMVNSCLAEPLSQVYVARYCSASQKERILELVDDILEEYEDMLRDEEWLSEKTKEGAVEKLQNIAVRAVYPDTFADYSALDLSSSDNLAEALSRIRAFLIEQKADKINTEKERNEWNLAELSTVVCNAYYIPIENSINILAGILASEIIYPQDASYEQLLGRIGAIIGHEITHGFDSNGYQYDKNGYYTSWWDAADVIDFERRAAKLADYYSGLIPYPGSAGYDGTMVESEAIADMGGVKCMLRIAKKINGFQYQEFFESYADMWKYITDYISEAYIAENDEHPLPYLRVNVTLQQFEEFYETYGITEGDGMYLAPDKRIAVW